MKYKKKPAVVEAVQWDGTEETLNQVVDWANATMTEVTLVRVGSTPPVLEIKNGGFANCGDWVIKGTANEVYTCRSDIFEDLYEEVPE